MERRLEFNIGDPPPEIEEAIKNGVLPREGRVWLTRPAIHPPEARLSRTEIFGENAVDAYELMLPFLGNELLTGAIRTMDVLNGCGRRCDTCLAASVLPSKAFSLDSLIRLNSDRRFSRMLQPVLRIGSVGDIQDHPDCIEIAKMFVALNPSRLIKIITNYRPVDEEKLDGLIKIAEEYPRNFDLGISLPFNQVDTVNERFIGYIKKRPEIFGNKYTPNSKRLLDTDVGGLTLLKNIHIQDVRHLEGLFVVGRFLSDELNHGRQPKGNFVYKNNNDLYIQRGLVKTYLNPDALWLMVYTTLHESHTTRLFTPITLQNLEAFSKLPFHPDFPKPKNWVRGTLRTWEKAKELFQKDESDRKPYKEFDIVKK